MEGREILVLNLTDNFRVAVGDCEVGWRFKARGTLLSVAETIQGYSHNPIETTSSG